MCYVVSEIATDLVMWIILFVSNFEDSICWSDSDTKIYTIAAQLLLAFSCKDSNGSEKLRWEIYLEKVYSRNQNIPANR